MKVSILIPVYNSEKHIEKTINSAISQSLSEIEIIVVNDGSTDRTEKILNEMKLNNSNLKVVHKKNEGVSSSRNLLLNLATGEFIQFLDADDWLDSSACELLYEFAIINKLDAVVSDFYKESDRHKTVYCEDLPMAVDFFDKDTYLDYMFSGGAYMAMWNKFFRRSLFKDIYFPVGVSFGEDLATLPRVIYSADKIGKLNQAFIHYVDNPQSITNSNLSLKMYQLFDSFDLLTVFFKKNSRGYLDIIENFKFNRICQFIFLKPYFGHLQYQLTFDTFLTLLKGKNEVKLKGRGLHIIIIRWLLFMPYSLNLKIVILNIDFIRSIRSRILN